MGLQKKTYFQNEKLLKLGKKYAGNYVALQKDVLLGFAKTQEKLFQKIKVKLNKNSDKLEVYYVPGKKEHLYLLKSDFCSH